MPDPTPTTGDRIAKKLQDEWTLASAEAPLTRDIPDPNCPHLEAERRKVASLIHAELAADIMPCGHHRSCVVSDKEGTCHCGYCHALSMAVSLGGCEQ